MLTIQMHNCTIFVYNHINTDTFFLILFLLFRKKKTLSVVNIENLQLFYQEDYQFALIHLEKDEQGLIPVKATKFIINISSRAANIPFANASIND